MALLMTANVRERRVEIAAFRAMGFRVGAILVVFLGKAMVLGVLGAMLGYVGGALVTAWYCDSAPQGPLIQTRLLVTAMAGSLGLVCAASALPAILAARTDPATILREE
jgi:ABC-type lipoprotein release transport system permease subunit